MHKLSLLIVLICAAALLGFAPQALDGNKEAQPQQPDVRDIAPEDRDWGGYVFDGDTTAEMNQRLAEAQKLLNDRMQDLLDQLEADLDDQGDALLMRSQNQWKVYALANAAFDADVYRGGSLAGPVGGMSYTTQICLRIKQLSQAIEARKPM